MSRKTEFEFVGKPAQYQVETEPGNEEQQQPVTTQPTVPTMTLPETQVCIAPTAESADGESWLVHLGTSLRQMFDRIAAEWRQAKLTVSLAAVAGAVFGLTVLGWYVWPVEWTDSTFSELSPAHKYAIVSMAAELSAYDPMNPAVARLTWLYDGIENDSCNLALSTSDPNKQQRLRYLTYMVTGGGDCNMAMMQQVSQPTE